MKQQSKPKTLKNAYSLYCEETDATMCREILKDPHRLAYIRHWWSNGGVVKEAWLRERGLI